MNNQIEVKKDLVDTVTGRKTFLKEVKVKIRYYQWWKKFLSIIFIIPRYHKKKLYISDPWPGTVLRLLGVMLDLKVNKDMEEREIYAMLQNNIPLFIQFLAIALHNKQTDPPQWLYEALEYQFTNDEIQATAADVYRRLDVSTFFAITASMVSVNRQMSDILEADDPTQ